MRLISIPGFVVAASLTLTPAAFAGSPDHGPHNVPTVHAATPPRNDGPKTHGSHESGDHGHHGPTPFIDRISANAALVAKLTPLLPSGMSLADAAKGFKNQGQFIATLHAAKDQGVSFVDLKAEMTGPEHDSLGQAIHDLKPATDAKSAAKTAEHEAHADISAARPTLVDRINGNAALLAKVNALLPSGMTLADAAAGFKNQGQFIAALHVSKNLNIAFDKLKAEMTGPERDSLGQAIHDLAPTADAKSAAKTAEQQAHTDIKTTRPPDTDAD